MVVNLLQIEMGGGVMKIFKKIVFIIAGLITLLPYTAKRSLMVDRLIIFYEK